MIKSSTGVQGEPCTIIYFMLANFYCHHHPLTGEKNHEKMSLVTDTDK